MDERQRFEAALALVDALADANERAPILVEGQRDLAALRALGCAGEVHLLHRGAALADVAHALARTTREVILLTDWDRAGLDLRERAAAHLRAHGLRCDTSYHERLTRDTELTLKDVETLPALISRGLHKFHRISLDEHVRARRGDPLGVHGIHEEFLHEPVPPRGTEKRVRASKPKRRARRDDGVQ